MSLIGNQNVLNKSCARFYGAPGTTGTATTGVQFAAGRGTFLKPSIVKSKQIFFNNASSLPDGYNIGEAISPAIKTGSVSSFTRIEGSGELTATAILARLSEATLSGTGSLSADLAVISPMEAALSGTGSIAADLQAVNSLAAALSGTGSVSASLSATFPLEAALSGSGAVAGSTNLTGIGSLEAEITPFTDLSPENLAATVLGSEIETGYNLEAALRLILSSVAGKISGAGTSTITIRSVTDGSDRIVATVDSNGNRESITYDIGDE